MQPILLIEDDENDIFFFERAAKKAEIRQPLVIVRDGREAVEYFQKLSPPNPIPCLIVLDLNLPQRNGLEVLEWIRAQPLPKIVPVVVLTSSTSDKDIQQAYEMGANSYLIKPGDPDKLVALVKLAKEYWLTANQSPPRPALTSGNKI
jgi:CheY-like chemotaxis protein